MTVIEGFHDMSSIQKSAILEALNINSATELNGQIWLIISAEKMVGFGLY